MNYYNFDKDFFNSENRSPVEQWFSSDAWESIINSAEDGDQDSVELMEMVNDQLNSLIFHLKNESNQSRIDYELSYFTKLCKEFDVE